MSDTQKIRAEVERLANIYDAISPRRLLDFIKHLEEEPISDGLEEAARKYADEKLRTLRPDISDTSYDRSTKMTLQLFEGFDLEMAFEDGANWQRQH